MAETATPQLSSIKARISALNLEQVGATPGTPAPYSYEAANTVKKPRPPPPPPPSHRPAAPDRSRSTNNPPLQSNGISSAPKAIGNQPGGPPAKPPAPPTLPARPALPARNNSSTPKPTPALPPRRPTEQSVVVRKPSVESVSSVASTRTSISAISSQTSYSNSYGVGKEELFKIKAPAFDASKLPPLPPKRQNTENTVKDVRSSVRPTKSSPSIDASKFAMPDRSVKAPMPTLPAWPALPARQTTLNKEEPQPVLPARPNGVPKRSALEWGMNKSTATPPPLPSSRPSANSSNTFQASVATPRGPSVVEVTELTFDRVIFAPGKPALVDFSAPYCKYCKELDPIYDQLGDAFASQSDRITIAKADVHAHPTLKDRFGIEGYPTLLWFDGRGGQPEKYQSWRTLEGLTEFITDHTGLEPNNNTSAGNVPPIPLGSRPDLSAIMASKPKLGAAPSVSAMPRTANECLICRDFSGPDTHAARFPRESIPSTDLSWLALQLCDPFPSATDKARVIFTWLHHNIDYNTVAFFGNNVKSSTPASTFATGLAVCEGYAALFTNLATHAGLESIVVSGGSKGYGYIKLKPGDPIPPYKSTHAWNAVKIDNGEWKLIDSCWGAGYVNGPDKPYTRKFSPHHFHQDNNEFGKSHFPTDKAQFFRIDGRSEISWAEFLMDGTGGEKVLVYTNAEPELGVGEATFQPALKHIKTNAPCEPAIVRFQFAYKCPHWDPLRHGQGKPRLLLMKIGGRDGRKETWLPLQYDGKMWWIDIERVELGCPGQDAVIFSLKTFDGRDGRNVTPQEFLRKWGKVACSFGGGIACWSLV